MIFSLAEDFAAALEALPQDHPKRHMLRLLDEAIRRDIHFIDRHPTTLCQCMWNTCWWYDCPEAEHHYVEPEGGWPPDYPPWNAPGEKLSDLISQWRRAKEEHTPDFPWIRSLRPPLDPLGSGCKAVFRSHAEPVNAVAWSPNGRWLASSADDCTIRAWSRKTGAEVWRHRLGPCAELPETDESRQMRRIYGLDVAFSPGGRWVAAGLLDGTIRIIEADTGRHVRALTGHEKHVDSIAFFPDGRLASGSSDKTIRIWDVETGDLLATLSHESDNAFPPLTVVRNIAVSPDGRTVASGDMHGHTHVWDVESGAVVACFSEEDGRAVNDVAFSPDGTHLALGIATGELSIYNLADGSRAWSFEHSDGLRCVDFSPDGAHVVAGSYDCRIWRFDVSGHPAPPTRWEAHEGVIYDVRHTSDGEHVISASGDGTFRLWQSETDIEPPRLREHALGVQVVAVAPDAGKVASLARDDTMCIWDGMTGVQRFSSFCNCSGKSYDNAYGIQFTFSAEYDRLYAQGTDGLYEWRASDGQLIEVHDAVMKVSSETRMATRCFYWKVIREGAETILIGSNTSLLASTRREEQEAPWRLPCFASRVDGALGDPTGRLWGGFAYLGYHVYLFRREGTFDGDDEL